MNNAAESEPRSHEGLCLVLYPNVILRGMSEPVDRFDSELRDLADEMFSLMNLHRGIGLAAPQVGLPRRLIVCSIEERPVALTNVELKDAFEPRTYVEGCLSLPGVQVNVRRPERIRLQGYDLKGQRRDFGAVGLWARVIQHELDHLNGVLICDYNHPEADECLKCALALPAVLIEERKHQSRPKSCR
jgi:peptide deformylase